MKARRTVVLVYSAFLFVISVATTSTVLAATGDVISVQLGILGEVNSDDLGGVVTSQLLEVTEETGAFPAANWNALEVEVLGNGNGWTEQSFALIDRDGTDTGVQLTVRGANDARWLANPPPDSAPITKLFNTYITGWYPPSGAGPNSLGEGRMELVLTGLDSGQTYNLYVYLADDNARNADVDAGTGVINYTGALASTVSADTSLVASVNQDPDDANRDPGNYVHLTGITPVSGTITVTVNYYDPAWESWGIGACGIQVVKANIDLVAPSITAQPASRAVYTDVPATFSVGVLGTPAPSVQWYQIVGGVTNSIAGAAGLSYTTPPATLDASGTEYFAAAANSVGTIVSAPATLTVVEPTADAGNVISVQLAKTGVGIFQPLAAMELTGAFPATNWNPLAVTVGAGSEKSYGLNDRNGIGTEVNLIVRGASDARSLSDPPPDSAPITKLFNTYITGWYPPSGAGPNSLGEGRMELVLTNLDNAQTYNLYVYLADDLGKNADVDAGSGVTNYTGALASTVSADTSLVASVNQDPDDANRDPGNYVHLTGITPVSGTITATVNYYDPAWESWGIGVCGFQLVKASADLVAPMVTGQPVSQRVVTNTPATFSVGILGTPTPSLQWYEVVGEAANPISNATDRSYTTAPVTDATSGRGYFVVLTSGADSVSSEAAYATAGHLESPAPGFLQLDQYNGATVEDLLDPAYLAATTPDRVRWVSSFESPGDLPDDSGERFYGWFTPPATADYVFFLASDDRSLLLVSTDSTPENRRQIAEEENWSGLNSWTSSGGDSTLNYKRSDQFIYNDLLPVPPWPDGNTIHLTAGVAYYIELVHEQGGGGQNAAVTYIIEGEPDPADGTPTVLTADQLSTMSAPDHLLPLPSPHIVDVTVSGSGATLSGTNGLLNGLYHVLSSTDVSQPVGSWTPVHTNVFDINGSFTTTVRRDASDSASFYRLLSVP